MQCCLAAQVGFLLLLIPKLPLHRLYKAVTFLIRLLFLCLSIPFHHFPGFLYLQLSS
jgi:hypothetical protein